MIKSNHFYHMVNVSPWPILISMNLFNEAVSFISWLATGNYQTLLMFTILISLIMYQWWRDVLHESMYEGWRSAKTDSMISTGVCLFILSEIMFFSSFFWAYLYYSLSPDYSIGLCWPPTFIKPINSMGIPLLNTLILLSSGFFITLCHYSFYNMNSISSKMSMMFCCILGTYFMFIQMIEYWTLEFSLNSSSYGSSFFILTGFHGLHVFIGLLFIIINFIQLLSPSFSILSIKGLEYSIWYWHFVDLVWLILYCLVYWWGC